MAGSNCLPLKTGIEAFDALIGLIRSSNRTPAFIEWAGNLIIRNAKILSTEDQTRLLSVIEGYIDAEEEAISARFGQIKKNLLQIPGFPRICRNIYGEVVAIDT